MAGRTRTIVQTYIIQAPSSKVFEALTSPSLLNRWWTKAATIDARSGGSYRFTWDGGYVHEGGVVAAEPARLLKLAWQQDRVPTEVTFRLERIPGGTELKFRQTGVGAAPNRFETYVGTHTGWVYYLSNLRAYLETGRDLRRSRDKYW